MTSTTNTNKSNNTVYVIGGGGGGYANNMGSCPGYGATPPHSTSSSSAYATGVTGPHGASGGYAIPSGTISISAGGTGGTTGSVWGASQSGTWTNMSTSILSIKTEGGGDAYVNTNKNKINLDEMAEVVQVVKERLLILTPNFEMHEKYPVLKDLYEQYKVVEAMLAEEETK
jgi:hypothetical protein